MKTFRIKFRKRQIRYDPSRWWLWRISVKSNPRGFLIGIEARKVGDDCDVEEEHTFYVQAPDLPLNAFLRVVQRQIYAEIGFYMRQDEFLHLTGSLTQYFQIPTTLPKRQGRFWHYPEEDNGKPTDDALAAARAQAAEWDLPRP